METLCDEAIVIVKRTSRKLHLVIMGVFESLFGEYGRRTQFKNIQSLPRIGKIITKIFNYICIMHLDKEKDCYSYKIIYKNLNLIINFILNVMNVFQISAQQFNYCLLDCETL